VLLYRFRAHIYGLLNRSYILIPPHIPKEQKKTTEKN